MLFFSSLIHTSFKLYQQKREPKLSKKAGFQKNFKFNLFPYKKILIVNKHYGSVPTVQVHIILQGQENVIKGQGKGHLWKLIWECN